MDVRYINPFIEAIRKVFQTMVKVPIALGNPYLKDLKGPMPEMYAVSAVVELRGHVQGLVAFHFSKAVALTLVSAFTQSPAASLDADCLDALGEIANMVVGNAKKDLPAAQTAEPITITPPKIVASDEVPYRQDHLVLALPIDAGAGRFILEASLRRAA